jgi:type IV pilus assembly protein PilA
MVKNLRNRLNDNKGFSLVELIVVIAIMVILIALLVPNVVGYISKAQDSANLSAAKSIYNAVNTAVIDYKAQHGGYPSPEELATSLNAAADNGKSEELAVVPKGTAVAVGYDGAGYVWAVAVGSEEEDLGDDSKNVQMYAPTAAGNAYGSGSNQTTDLPTDLTKKGTGSDDWVGSSTAGDVNELFQ